MTDNKKIDIVPLGVDACGYYRLAQQGRLLQMMNRDVTLSPALKFRFIGQDVLYTQRLCSEGLLKAVKDFKEKTKIKIYCDFDDLVWEYLGEGLPEYNWVNTKVDWKKNTEAMKSMLDVVVDKVSVSTEFLKDAVKQFVPEEKITVIPNMLNVQDWHFDVATQYPRELSFYYAGSMTHYWNDRKLAGDFEPGWVKYLQNKKIITKASTPFFMKPLHQYGPSALNTYSKDFYNEARQCKFVIAPLADNVFNRCKSPLKLLETAAIGRVCLVSDFTDCPYSALAHPYQKIPAGTTYKGIEYIVQRAEEHYSEILKHQYEVLKNYWLDSHMDVYTKFLFE